MRKLGFWNDERDQVLAINQAADELDAVQSGVNFTHQRVDHLQRVVERQGAELVRLKAALQAVCDLIVDLDLIEEEALAYRIDAALADAAEVAEVAEPAPPGPFAAHAPAPAPAGSEADCSRCRCRVPARDISFTDRGPMCEACIGALAAASE